MRLLKVRKSVTEVPLTHGFADRNYRILGVAEMEKAIAMGNAHRASAELGYHVLEVMEAIVQDGGKGTMIASRCERPAALPSQPRLGILE